MRLTIPLPALLRRMLLASAGLAVFALGNFLTVKANIGQAPWCSIWDWPTTCR